MKELEDLFKACVKLLRAHNGDPKVHLALARDGTLFLVEREACKEYYGLQVEPVRDGYMELWVHGNEVSIQEFPIKSYAEP